MDFSEQTVAAWGRQDQSILARTSARANTPALAAGVNANGRVMLVLANGTVAAAPTNSNANLEGKSVKYGAGLALSRVSSV